MTAPQLSWTFFFEFPIKVVHVKQDLGTPAFPWSLLLGRRAGGCEEWAPENEGGGGKPLLARV